MLLWQPLILYHLLLFVRGMCEHLDCHTTAARVLGLSHRTVNIQAHGPCICPLKVWHYTVLARMKLVVFWRAHWSELHPTKGGGTSVTVTADCKGEINHDSIIDSSVGDLTMQWISLSPGVKI